MKCERKTSTLRIAIERGTHVQTWILQGRLAGQNVDELAACWNATREDRVDKNCIVDLIDVTTVDEKGEAQLLEMMNEGARFVGRGVYTTSLLASLSERQHREA
jgi:ABC-type transporter Mla MlaB component